MAGKSKRSSKRGMMPKLRFPEFDQDGDWSTKPLSEVCERITEKVGESKLTTVSISAGVGFVSQAEKFGRDISGAQYDKYIYLRSGEFAYNKGNSNLYPQGCVYRLKEFQEAAASNAFICFRLLDDYVPGFFEGLFEKNTHGNQLIKFLTSGARSDGLLNIKADDFFSISMPIPPRSAEQHQIAACLSSLDELIGSERWKLEALKDHKKGLMQQLFPREGETLPRLRFPEFKDTPEWEIKTLSEIAENLDSQRVPITEKDREKGEIPYYGASGIVDYVKDYLFDEALLCVSEDGANLLARTTPIAFSISGKTWVNNHAHVLRFDNLATQKVAEDYLNLISLADFITGIAQPKLNKANLNQIPIPHPTDEDEQQQLADFLCNVDNLVSAQVKKLNALGNHKSGLMQQLFPDLEDSHP